MKPKLKLMLKLISSIIIDISVVYTLSLLLNILLIHFIYIDILNIYLCVLFIYTIVFYSLIEQTPGKFFLKLKLISNNDTNLSFIKIFKREFLYKYFLGIIIPYIILILLGYNDNNLCVLFSFSIMLFASFLFWVIKKKTWWDYIAKTEIVTIETQKNIQLYYLVILFFWISSLLIIRYDNNSKQSSDLNVLGFNYPLNNMEYPNNENVDKHVTFLQKQSLNPKDYIFNLFKKYDVIILCERLHPEMTQWDLIYDIVSDDRFVSDVGNVFTEYGAYNKQSLVDSFLRTTYQSDSLLEKATGNIMHYADPLGSIWEKGPFFYFLKKINKFNSNLPDSLKINEYFTGLNCVWDYAKNYTDIENERKLDRDSIMAQNVIIRFNEILKNSKRKKCLIITNYQHAFGLRNKDGNFVRFSKYNEAFYLFKTYPKKVANILINTVSATNFEFLSPPIQHGLWDKAFLLMGNKPLGFNFNNGPFGNDEFDLFPSIKKYKFKYKDIFTGFIFYKPINEFIMQNGYPYMITGFEDEFTRRLKVENRNKIDINAIIQTYKILEKRPSDKIKYLISFINCLKLIFLFILIFLGFLITTCLFLKYRLKRK